ncbi:MAG: [protein-PII] uridylyltransferase [Verrucomicrobia bacterium]|nr:[protein-PII] uridylyltransferase [Verrucomicrobiota bacterium]
MLTLAEKIESDALLRLRPSVNHHPSQELARFKKFLKVERHRLQILHRSGGGGRFICEGQAAVFDVLLRHILEALQNQPLKERSQQKPVALVAIGGYGRGELNPRSDIDIMFLHTSQFTARSKPDPYLTAITDGLLYTLWDIGLKVGHSVRTVEDCVQVATGDMLSQTSLIEARLIAGDRQLFERMQTVVLAKCVRDREQSYIAARIADQEARRAKHGNSACMLEPNIKNGCGGLRDYQNLLWMAHFKYRARSLEELERREMVSTAERKQLDAAYDYLLRVRNELHYQTDRPLDAVPKSLQPTIAFQLGHTHRSPHVRLEHFMRQVYTHMRNIHLITRTVERRLALLPAPKRLPSLRRIIQTTRRRTSQQLVDGFKFFDGEILAATPQPFVDDPTRLMRLFLHAQQRGLRLHPDLEQLVRNRLNLVDRSFLRNPHIRETFLEILNQRGSVAPVLRSMHEVGLLGKYLPEFGRLTCLVQHEFYHRYTTDEHTLVCIEKLDRISTAAEPPFGDYKDIFHRVERPSILYLALLLHDAGKTEASGDHSKTGSRLAKRVAKRLELDEPATRLLCALIEHHLLMVQISQRRDLDDSSVIQNFAVTVGSTDLLDMLTLHTFSDSQGTSPDLWNGFKNSLLLTLHHHTLRQLTGGPESLRADAKHKAFLLEEVRSQLSKDFPDDETIAHFDYLPQRYFEAQSAAEIVSDLDLVHRFMGQLVREHEKALEPVVAWRNEPDRGYSIVHICTWDRAGLFSKIAGCVTASGLNILNAQIYTRSDGIILDRLFVADARTGLLAKSDERDKFERHLRIALTASVKIEDLFDGKKPASSVYKSLDEDIIETKIRFDNETSDSYTIIEVEAEDRVGLLYSVSRKLFELDLDIALAKISTEMGAAIDTFYVCQADGGKVPSQKRLDFIAGKLRTAISALRSV